ncbi:MAG TPA: gamma-glutamylcyclotransferase [Pseudolabrys sp.]|nr:gamma-glutamylcyclotransferase [Pseudolabrys sp.]
MKSPPYVADDLWVFAYGSLMWSPGFDYVERVHARMTGVHRSLCIYSFVHRGTPEKPGLVLGLDRGGACRGIGYRVAARNRDATIAYLRKREQATMIYREVVRTMRIEDTPQRQVSALCYVVDRGHTQYAGRLTLDEQVRFINQGHGISGANPDYVIETVKAMETLGYREGELHRLAERLRPAR